MQHSARVLRAECLRAYVFGVVAVLSLSFCVQEDRAPLKQKKTHTSRSGPLVRDRRPPTTRAVELNTKKKKPIRVCCNLRGFTAVRDFHSFEIHTFWKKFIVVIDKLGQFLRKYCQSDKKNRRKNSKSTELSIKCHF